jgi:hypothetical protein
VFRLFLERTFDGACQAKHLRTRNLQNHLSGVVQVSDYDLAVALTVSLHLDFIFRGF